jgi:hypothetical protein
VPTSYAHVRAGHSAKNIGRLRDLGVRDIGWAPRGHTAWAVKGHGKEELIRERTLVEGSIGTIKNLRYGFNRPPAWSVARMGVCGQRAVLGFKLGKLVRGTAQKRRREVVWLPKSGRAGAWLGDPSGEPPLVVARPGPGPACVGISGQTPARRMSTMG